MARLSPLAPRPNAQADALARVTDDDVRHARTTLRRVNPRLAALCDASRDTEDRGEPADDDA